MPSLLLGRERFVLPVGETRIGGSGDGAVPFAALRKLPTVAIVHITPAHVVTVWPAHGGVADTVVIDGVPLGSEPVAVRHGAKIDVGGIRLIFRDGRETGTTGPSATIIRSQLAHPVSGHERRDTAGRAQLVRHEGKTVVDIPDSGLVIGRDPDSDLVVSGLEVSRRHAVLRGSARGYLLTDVSTNGTYVNGVRVAGSVTLQVGDVVRIGEAEFTFDGGRVAYDPAVAPTARPRQPMPEPATVVRSRPRIWWRLSKLWRS